MPTDTYTLGCATVTARNHMLTIQADETEFHFDSMGDQLLEDYSEGAWPADEKAFYEKRRVMNERMRGEFATMRDTGAGAFGDTYASNTEGGVTIAGGIATISLTRDSVGGSIKTKLTKKATADMLGALLMFTADYAKLSGPRTTDHTEMVGGNGCHYSS